MKTIFPNLHIQFINIEHVPNIVKITLKWPRAPKKFHRYFALKFAPYQWQLLYKNKIKNHVIVKPIHSSFAWNLKWFHIFIIDMLPHQKEQSNLDQCTPMFNVLTHCCERTRKVSL